MRTTPESYGGISSTSVGSGYTPAQVEFLVAIERYQRRTGRRYPTAAEVLAIAVALGYRRVAPPSPLPSRHPCPSISRPRP